MAQLQFQVVHDHARIGRVLMEDDDFMVIEIAKDPNRKREVAQNDRYLTMSFVHQVGDLLASHLPWKA